MRQQMVFKKFKVGHLYVVGFKVNRLKKCKFIKVTGKGYNFLDLETDECFLQRHLYRANFDEDKFRVPYGFHSSKANTDMQDFPDDHPLVRQPFSKHPS